MRPIPITAAEHIAKEYGYDQVVIMARRISNPLPPINPDKAQNDDGISGEHITTYGVNKVHCDVAALMGNVLKDIAHWPERADFELARALLDDLESGIFDYSDYDETSARVGALSRILHQGKR